MDASILEWGIGSVVVPLVGAMGTVMWSLQRQIGKDRAFNSKQLAEDRAENDLVIQRAKQSMEISLNMLREDQHAFQLRIVGTYVTVTAMKDVEARIERGISDVREDVGLLATKLDRIIERQVRDD